MIRETTDHVLLSKNKDAEEKRIGMGERSIGRGSFHGNGKIGTVYGYLLWHPPSDWETVIRL